MNKKHKHYELIIAWANGSKIERKNSNGYWVEMLESPMWHEDVEYRIKSEKWAPKCGLFLRDTNELTMSANKEIRRYLLLLAYRDEFDPEFVYNPDQQNFYIYSELITNKWHVSDDDEFYDLCKVYMSEDVAIELAKKLNSSEVVI